MRLSKDERNGTVYSFGCTCGVEYIGESYRRLHYRIIEHNRTKGTNIFDHISECPIYKEKLDNKNKEMNQNTIVKPTLSLKREFTAECFKILHSNVTNYYKRTRLEAIAITLNSPALNDQVKHKKVSII